MVAVARPGLPHVVLAAVKRVNQRRGLAGVVPRDAVLRETRETIGDPTLTEAELTCALEFLRGATLVKLPSPRLVVWTPHEDLL